MKPGEKVTLIKYTAIVSSLQCDRQELVERAVNEAKAAREQGWESLTAAHKERWAKSGRRRTWRSKETRKHSRAYGSTSSS